MAAATLLDATAQAELVRDGQATPLELVEECIARIEKVNPAVNAVTLKLYEKARQEAASVPWDAPFAGVPYVLKDITMHSKGDLYTAGMLGLKTAGYRSDHDSTFVQKMRRAGFVLVGKASTSELAMFESTEPPAWGPCRNPWNLDRSVGGSSGGSAAAVAAGMVTIAHGNDGGGSIRSPASHCGVVGLKPTRGRISSGPLITESDNVAGGALEGFLTHSVRDQAAALDMVQGRCAGDAYFAPPPARPFVQEVGASPGRLRIGLLTHDPAGLVTVDPDAVRAAKLAADTLADLGHEVVEAYPAAFDNGMWPTQWFGCIGVVIARELEWYGRQIGRPITPDDVHPAIWAYAENGKTISGIQYAAGIDSLRGYARDIERWWTDDGFDLLLTPTIPVAAPRIGELTATADNPSASVAMDILQYTVVFNMTGLPAISLPLYQRADGMPQGVQLGAAYGREDHLFQVAAQLEQALPWAGRVAPNFA